MMGASGVYGPGKETKQPQRQRKEWLPACGAGSFRALKTVDCAQRIIIFHAYSFV